MFYCIYKATATSNTTGDDRSLLINNLWAQCFAAPQNPTETVVKYENDKSTNNANNLSRTRQKPRQQKSSVVKSKGSTEKVCVIFSNFYF
jgi:hypothetical protein